MTLKVCFVDLTHTGQLIAANTVPLGISYVATYAKQILQDEIDNWEALHIIGKIRIHKSLQI